MILDNEIMNVRFDEHIMELIIQVENSIVEKKRS